MDQYYFMDFMFLEHDLEQYFQCNNLSNTVLYNNSTLCSFCNPGNFFPHNYYTQIDFSASNPTNKSATKQVLHSVIHANVTLEIDCFTEQIYSRVYLCPLWKNKFPTWSEKLTWSLLQGKIPLGYNDDRFWQKKSHFRSWEVASSTKDTFFHEWNFTHDCQLQKFCFQVDMLQECSCSTLSLILCMSGLGFSLLLQFCLSPSLKNQWQ